MLSSVPPPPYGFGPPAAGITSPPAMASADARPEGSAGARAYARRRGAWRMPPSAADTGNRASTSTPDCIAGPAASPTPVPSPSVPASTARSGHGQTPTQPNTSLEEEHHLCRRSRWRRIACKVKVRSPKPPLQDAKLAAYGKKLVGCLIKTFAKPLAAHGIQLRTPKVKTYRHTIKTPCGRFGQRDAPAYYCSVTRTIYWPVSGDDGNEAYTFARLGYVGLVAHEFGHHYAGGERHAPGIWPTLLRDQEPWRAVSAEPSARSSRRSASRAFSSLRGAIDSAQQQ